MASPHAQKCKRGAVHRHAEEHTHYLLLSLTHTAFPSPPIWSRTVPPKGTISAGSLCCPSPPWPRAHRPTPVRSTQAPRGHRPGSRARPGLPPRCSPGLPSPLSQPQLSLGRHQGVGAGDTPTVRAKGAAALRWARRDLPLPPRPALAAGLGGTPRGPLPLLRPSRAPVPNGAAPIAAAREPPHHVGAQTRAGGRWRRRRGGRGAGRTGQPPGGAALGPPRGGERGGGGAAHR